MKISPRMSPTLSGLLNDVVYKEEEVEMSPEEASLLQEEINNISEQIESDTTDLSIVSKSLNRVLELTEDMNTAVDTDTTDKHTAGLLLSEFASIYKDTMGQEFLYSKNLSDNPLEVKQILTAGLQSASSFIETLKKIVKKIWESLKTAAKWFWSKVKQFINWIFGKRKKAEKIQESNTAAVSLLTATVKTKEKFAEEVNNAENLTEEAKQDLEVKIEKDISNNFKEEMKSKGFDGKLDDLYEYIADAFRKMDIIIAQSSIILNSDRAANRVMTNLIDRVSEDKNLSSNVSAMTAIFSTSSVFEIYNIDQLGSYVNPGLTLKNVLGKSYASNSYKIGNAYRETDSWRPKIDEAINSDAGLLDNDVREIAFRIIFNAMFEISDYDKLCGLGGRSGSNKGIVNSLAAYLSGIYSSYSILFKKINEQTASLDKTLSDSNSDLSKTDKGISQIGILRAIDENPILTKHDSYLDNDLVSAVAMPAKIFIDDTGVVNCNWINFLISGSTKIKNVDLSNIKKKLEIEYSKDNILMGISSDTGLALRKLREQGVVTKKIGSSNLEKELIKETDKLQSAYEKMFVEVDKYIKWFSDVPVAAIDPKRDTFNNLFTMVQHLNKITPSLPLDMLRDNQLIADSILSSIDFKEEVIRAYKEVLAEDK